MSVAAASKRCWMLTVASEWCGEACPDVVFDTTIFGNVRKVRDGSLVTRVVVLLG